MDSFSFIRASLARCFFRSYATADPTSFGNGAATAGGIVDDIGRGLTGAIMADFAADAAVEAGGAPAIGGGRGGILPGYPLTTGGGAGTLGTL